MKRVLYPFILFWILVFPAGGYAQTCVHTDLSTKFDYQITYRTTRPKGMDTYNSSMVTVTVTDKKTKKIKHKLAFIAGLLFDTAFKDCTAVKSYVTGKNTKIDVVDYDFGDFIVADLNFDGKEDFAIKYDSGGNGGPFYRFYMGDNTGSFKIDHFLTERVGAFPKYISVKHKTLTTQRRAGTRFEARKSFRYNTATKKWKLVKLDMI